MVEGQEPGKGGERDVRQGEEGGKVRGRAGKQSSFGD